MSVTLMGTAITGFVIPLLAALWLHRSPSGWVY